MGVIYFFPGFWKFFESGFDWAFSDNLPNTMHQKWAELGDWRPLLRIDHYPLVYQIMGVGTLVFEMGFVFLILFRRTRVAGIPPWTSVPQRH